MNPLGSRSLWLVSIFLPIIALAQGLDIYFLDVGQGDAVFVGTPSGNTLAVDFGPLLAGYSVTRKLTELGVKGIDRAIVTHPHLDHFGGLFDVMPRFPIGRFHDNGAINPDWVYFDDYRSLRNRLNYQALQAGTAWRWGGVDFEILNPRSRSEETSLNNGNLNSNSVVLRIKYHKVTFLLTGDLDKIGELALLQTGIELKSTVLKIGHHGADDATSEAWLNAVQPEIAIISVAKKNRWNSPAPTVLDRLRAHKIKVLRTDRDGTIHIHTDGTRYDIQTQ